ncbi:adenine phosphoribosyltransferase [Arenicella sp. 4NH20-0111]|uniref:adenine phosphoribosyltransferase n=1 Tax=Arenicella sp. 4NH20-0111 TaxID=3127648 RepID=UPI003106A85D
MSFYNHTISRVMDLAAIIRTIPDFPKPGIQFKDIESITENPEAFRYVIDSFSDKVQELKVDKLLVLDARGFLFGAAIGYKEGLPIVMARKKGKLGGETVTESYSLEYGDATVELQKTAISKGDRVAIIDDLLATGGTASAASSLIEKLDAHVVLCAFVIELDALNGRLQLPDSEVHSLVHF